VPELGKMIVRSEKMSGEHQVKSIRSQTKSSEKNEGRFASMQKINRANKLGNLAEKGY